MVMRWLTGFIVAISLPVAVIGFLWGAVRLAFSAGVEFFDHYTDGP